MALINRVTRLFTADMHAVLDRLEEPDVLLRQAVREMEEELGRSERHAKLAELEHARCAKRQQQVHAAFAELDEKIGIAFEAGNETLARKLVKRKLETAQLDKHLAERCGALETALAERQAIAVEQRERLDVMRQKAELLASEPRGNAAHAPSDASEFAVSDEEVEVEWLRERQRRARS